MPVWAIFLILSLFQFVIYGVLRVMARQVTRGNPPPMLRFAVSFAGVVGILILAAAVYAYVTGI